MGKISSNSYHKRAKNGKVILQRLINLSRQEGINLIMKQNEKITKEEARNYYDTLRKAYIEGNGEYE